MPPCRCRPATALRAGLAALALLVAGCASETEEPDWFDRLRASAGIAPLPAAQDPVIRDAAAGQPYPNLASVPGRPTPHDPARRSAQVAGLERERAEALARRRALEAGQVTPARAGWIGTVQPDAAGGFAPADEAILRRAVDVLAGKGAEGRVRLGGPAAAMLSAADRLQRLGVARARIVLEPSAAPSPQVEILVVSGAAGR
jgi:hypothetical protein